MTLPLGITGSLEPAFQHLLGLSSSQSSIEYSYALRRSSVRLPIPLVHLRYSLEGYRPSQTTPTTSLLLLRSGRRFA